MIHRVTCPKCGSLVEYDDRSIFEGNREREDYECPICNEIIGTAFTDQIPIVTLIRKGPAQK